MPDVTPIAAIQTFMEAADASAALSAITEPLTTEEAATFRSEIGAETAGAAAAVTTSSIGAATAAKFIAGAGALTGPAAPLTIGTAAASAVGDFATAAQGYKADTALLSPSYQTWTPASAVAMLGDSITGLEVKYSVNNRAMFTTWHNYLNIFLNQRITWVNNPATDVRSFGVQGNTAEQILARVPDVLATAADTVLVMAGTNNLASNTPAVLAPKVVAIWDAIITGGKQVMATEILPRLDSTINSKVNATNDILRIEAAKRGIPFVVWGSDVRSGPYARADLFTLSLGDIGVHPGNFGGPVIGRIAAEQLDKWVQPTPYAIPAAGLVTAGGAWVTRNAYMAGGTTIPTDWFATAFGGGVGAVTTSKSAWIAGGELSNTWLNVKLASGPLVAGVNIDCYQSAGASGLVANDWVQPVCRVIIQPRSNWQSFNFKALFNGDSGTCGSYGVFDGGTATAQIIPDGVHEGQITGIILGPKTQVTANAAAGAIYCTLAMYGHGSVSVSQMGLLKTTAPA